ncbi:hypothetical protein [Devosia chinhatensis]|uniref:ATPase AAA n=1 Tax=Devosia chinhatensis TaxID=429727 RepID=A0A0F5FLL9_9HYPH|nr:hypothetical protein [Devosia chinhatensis]KKB09741.1 hypothetical protein VE26_07740 [Devosia chinhatensis]
MGHLPTITSLGHRIVIMGPSNAGKSTLASALGQCLHLPVHHLDVYRHLPHTDWQQRDDADFQRLHDEAIASDAWIVEGNYSALLPQRLARATSVLVIDDSLVRRYWRYVWRTTQKRKRAGALPGNRDTIKWQMIHWIWHTRHSAKRTRERISRMDLPHHFVANQGELDALYDAWHLKRTR